jgi:hypothetical protein
MKALVAKRAHWTYEYLHVSKINIPSPEGTRGTEAIDTTVDGLNISSVRKQEASL